MKKIKKNIINKDNSKYFTDFVPESLPLWVFIQQEARIKSLEWELERKTKKNKHNIWKK
ncbi:hypothetical protein [endosymbiont GvMRE of Glomus versiforme]|uniref:hypothetical protein n=1 Tax=endosymbiont GvMRE of Glomus versiforme TaxID=2039283 RepID=UPI000ECD53DA|nr:hypothetical protein [endosymbiont GvMRE of Glomus versiforme]RHZ37203.1 hypothetical protein GvMRE_I1g484 [endosymbiont GvMRE of Glomus versiforme]